MPSSVGLSGLCQPATTAATQDEIRELLYCCSQPFYQGPEGIRVMVSCLELCFLQQCFLNVSCHSSRVSSLISMLCKAVVLYCCSGCSIIVACCVPIYPLPLLSFSPSLMPNSYSRQLVILPQRQVEQSWSVTVGCHGGWLEERMQTVQHTLKSLTN